MKPSLRFIIAGTAFAGLLWLLSLYACRRQELDPLPFFEVYTRPLSGRLDNIVLTGQVAGLDDNAPDEVGFMYNSSLDRIQGSAPTGTVLPAQLGNGGNFETVFNSLGPQEAFFVRAFARIADRIVYGEILSYRQGEIVSMGAVEIYNDSVVLHGSLIGLKITGDTVLDHGHIISPVDTNPVFNVLACCNVQLGSKDIDYAFQTHIGNLQLNTTYYVRAYARSKTKTFYSPAIPFRVRDGWKKMPEISPLQHAHAAVAGGKAYAGFGCGGTSDCVQESLPTDFWEFTPNGAGGVWGKSSPVDPFYTRTRVASFAIGDTIYWLTGEYNIAGVGEPLFVYDLIKFNTVDKTWTEDFNFPDLPKRSGAVAFAVNGKGYLGAGEGSDGTRIAPFNDFWEYDPGSGTWRQVASLPSVNPESASNIQAEGRAEAACFILNGSAYVGCGRTGYATRKDFWRFIAPANAQDPGRWELAGFFPGMARYAAASFAIGGKGYLGLGYNPLEGAFGDFWEYNPADNTWQSRTSFPGGKRYAAIGFAIDDHGYAGTGLQPKVAPNGAFGFSEINDDLWRYEPEKQ